MDVVMLFQTKLSVVECQPAYSTATEMQPRVSFWYACASISLGNVAAFPAVLYSSCGSHSTVLYSLCCVGETSDGPTPSPLAATSRRPSLDSAQPWH